MKPLTHRRNAHASSALPDGGEQILNSAARLFCRLGYAAVSLRDVAAEAGVTTGSLYHHFRSKDDLVRELLDRGHQQILREVQTAIQSDDAQASPRATLLAGLSAHLNCLLAPDSLPAANIRIFAHVPESLRKATLRGRRNYERFWIDLLRTFAGDGFIRPKIEPKALVMILFGAMNWSLEWFKPGRDQVQDLAIDLLQLVVEPLATSEDVSA